VTEPQKEAPQFSGMVQHADETGFGIWIPTGWHETKVTEGTKGMLYSPYPDDINTGVLAITNRLKVNITDSDLPILREGFLSGVKALPGVELELETESLSNTYSFFEARFTYLDGNVRRKRWVRNIYWNKSNYIIIAQGKTVEEFDYWMPIFYNIMMTANV
jgi:hypothetical protein